MGEKTAEIIPFLEADTLKSWSNEADTKKDTKREQARKTTEQAFTVVCPTLFSLSHCIRRLLRYFFPKCPQRKFKTTDKLCICLCTIRVLYKATNYCNI